MKGIKRILIWSKKYIVFIILLLLLNFLLQWLYSYLPVFVQYAFKVLGYNEGSSTNLPTFLINWYKKAPDVLTTILLVSISMVVLQLIRSIMRFLSNYLQGYISQKLIYDMRIKLYSHIVDLPFSYHNNVDIGDLIQRSTSDIEQISNFISVQVVNFLSIFITVIIGAYQVASISVTLMLVSIVIVPITAISSIFYFRYCTKKFDEIEQSESKMTTTIQENVNAARVVRAFANEKYEFDKMDEINKEYSDKNLKFNTKMALFWGISDATVVLQYILTLGIGIYLARNNKLDLADIIASLLLMNMLVWPMRGLGRTIASFGKANVSANRVQEILTKKSEYEINGAKKPLITGDIEFKNVTFKFDDDERNLLNDISFKIKAGQTVALVGKTGAGKSTICNILVRFLEYQKGSVLINGVELKDIDKKYLRENIKYVLQNPFLFSKSVYDNIAISNKDISEEKVMAAAKTAAIHNEVVKFENGYKTIVGEKGTTLSGGQKQRVAIARMLITDSPVIIFDDSLSALDTQTDVLIRKALKLKDEKQTTIVITHRTTTAKEADLILVLDEGRIVASGTHAELLKQEGLYKELWGIQGELEKQFLEVLNRKEAA